MGQHFDSDHPGGHEHADGEPVLEPVGAGRDEDEVDLTEQRFFAEGPELKRF
ncbi:MAG: hypothetical protein U5R31_03540 [Acidimicrobiia bacterium]|nr:hypothetical protein [Acidimicrobiia bacterium]